MRRGEDIGGGNRAESSGKDGHIHLARELHWISSRGLTAVVLPWSIGTLFPSYISQKNLLDWLLGLRWLNGVAF